MTNYNERLDELMPCDCKFLKGFAWRKGDPCEGCINGRLKQAITSLTKEMVAEAKPDNRELIEPITGKPVSRGDKVTFDVEADPRGSLIFVQNNGYNMALNQFEQNLLKELEEV